MDVQRAIRQRLQTLGLAGVETFPRPDPDAAPLPIGDKGDPIGGSAPNESGSPSRTATTVSTGNTAHSSHAPQVAPSQQGHGGQDKQLQLGQLCDQVANCQLCPQLVESRTQTVFGVGDPNARLCFFGEGPGADEDRQGEPFVGAAGQLLNKIIEACTLKREQVYILNTVKCRPQGNRNPTDQEVENCRWFYEQQLEIIQPEFICCLGAVAARALLGDQASSISRMRGKFFEWRNTNVVVTYHPAYLLRQPDAKKKVWDDMKFLMNRMGIKL